MLGSARYWEPAWDPFHPALFRYTRKLTPGGLMVVQSIGYSLDAKGHPNYIPAVERQLTENGLRLLELWRFTKLPGVMLYVAQKNGGERPPMQTPFTTFHGQTEIQSPIERVYP